MRAVRLGVQLPPHPAAVQPLVALLLYFLAGIVTVLLNLLATDYPRVPGKWISFGAGLLLGFAGYYFPRRRDLDCPRCDWKRTEWIRPVWRESAASLVRER